VSQNDLDGVDVDYEDLNAFNAGDGSAENWLITFTTALRSALPSGAILTHARELLVGCHLSLVLTVIIALAPWFEPNGRWGGGGMLKVDSSVGSLIDWYNVQFYNRKPHLCIIPPPSLKFHLFFQRVPPSTQTVLVS
jgi:chitinase